MRAILTNSCLRICANTRSAPSSGQPTSTEPMYCTQRGRSQVSGWGIGVNAPYSLITEQMRTSLLLSGGAAVLAIAIAFALSFRFARQITTSLSLASKAAAAFGHGQSFPITGSRLVEADAFLATLRNAQEELFKAHSHEKFLVRELQHRTQNSFAVMQSIISRSLADGQSL